MTNTGLIILFTLYHIGLLSCGFILMRKWAAGLPLLFIGAGSFLLGVGIGVPVTYACTGLFTHTNVPIEWGIGMCVIFFTKILQDKELPDVLEFIHI